MKADRPLYREAEFPLSEHQAKVLGRYGGNEFDARIKAFPDGYHNLGYWEEGCGRMTASRTLIEKVAEPLSIGPDDCVLDVGAGVGRGTVDLYQRHGCRRLVGIDLTPEHVDYARRLAAEEGCGDAVEFRHMSATRLDFPDASFDKILSVDSGIHFDTREQFFSEAFRLLKPGGMLGLADTCINPKALRLTYRWPTRLLLKLWCVPLENVHSLQTCRLLLEQQGFISVEAHSIGDRTLAPVCDYFMSDEHWSLAMVSEGYKEACLSRMVFGVMKFAYRRRLIDYGLLKAIKA